MEENASLTEFILEEQTRLIDNESPEYVNLIEELPQTLEEFCANEDLYYFRSEAWFDDLWCPIYNRHDVFITKNIIGFLYCQKSFENLDINTGLQFYKNILTSNDLYYEEKKENNWHTQYRYFKEEDNATIRLSLKDFKKSLSYFNFPRVLYTFYEIEEIAMDYKEYILEFKYHQSLIT